MKITHISDTHGHFPDLIGDPDVVVHSGDFCPNRSYGVRAIEESYQSYWIEQNKSRLREWIGDRALLFCHGNHDFVKLEPLLRAIGIEAYCLDDKRIEHGELSFYGFPWVPEFGNWNYGLSPTTLLAATEHMSSYLGPDNPVDVLVCHSPPYGVLDRNHDGERCGNKPLRKLLQDSDHSLKYVMCGHIHESHGIQPWSRGLTISNAATTQHAIPDIR